MLGVFHHSQTLNTSRFFGRSSMVFVFTQWQTHYTHMQVKDKLKIIVSTSRLSVCQKVISLNLLFSLSPQMSQLALAGFSIDHCGPYGYTWLPTLQPNSKLSLRSEVHSTDWDTNFKTVQHQLSSEASEERKKKKGKKKKLSCSLQGTRKPFCLSWTD